MMTVIFIQRRVSDGCDYIRNDNYERIPWGTFYTNDADSVRLAALSGNPDAKVEFQNWFQSVINALPTVYHMSWYDIERKIKIYKNYWSKHWQSLYNIKQEDTIENNMFFDCKWSDVTDDMIEKKAQDLKEKRVVGFFIENGLEQNYRTCS